MSRRRPLSSLSFLLVLAGSVVIWLPLVIAGQTPAIAATTPVPDMRVDVQLGNDLISDGSSVIRQTSAPHFNALCGNDQGLWSQTITAGRTAYLSEIELLLLRRSADIDGPVRVELRAVDGAGQVTQTVLGQGASASAIPVHRSEPGWLMVSLDVPIQLDAGQKVAIFPTAALSTSGACYEWVSGGLDQYTGGSIVVSRDAGASFGPDGPKDAGFRTWIR